MERAERSLLQPMGSPGAKDLHPLLPSSPSPFEELERRCAAFVRRDLHSSPSLPFLSKARLLIALLTLLPLRVAAATLIVLVYYFICRFCTFLSFHPNHDSDSVEDEAEEDEEKSFVHVRGWRRAVIVSSGRFLSRAMLFAMGFYWISASRCDEYLCTNDQEHERPGVIISNHVSYVDILYHMSSSFPSFVAKRSVARLPLVGIISKCLGCVYVQRESKSSDSKGVAGVVMDRIQKAHQNKLAPIMLIFPEGTTTNGDYLLPFKSGAFLAKAPALPVILKYPYERFSPAWDSISGVRHIILLLCQFVNHLEATHLPVYYPSQQEKDDPKLYANNLRKLMAVEGNLTLSEIGLAEKRVYHAALNGNGLPCDLHQKDD